MSSPGRSRDAEDLGPCRSAAVANHDMTVNLYLVSINQTPRLKSPDLHGRVLLLGGRKGGRSRSHFPGSLARGIAGPVFDAVRACATSKLTLFLGTLDLFEDLLIVFPPTSLTL